MVNGRSEVGKASKWAGSGSYLTEKDIALGGPVEAFASYINHLHDPKWNYKGDGIFGANPWVAALTFTVDQRNIDEPRA